MGEKGLGEYVKDRKEGHTELGRVLEKRKQSKITELEELEIEALIAKRKKEIKEAEATNKPIQPRQSQGMVAALLADKKPEEVKQILEALGPEEIQKLALIAASQNGNQTALLMQSLGKQGTSVKDTIELIHTINKMTQPAGSQSGAKDLIEAFRVGLEAAKAQQPQPSSKDSAMDVAMKYIKPMYDSMTEKDRALYAEQLRNLESKIVDPISYLERIKEVAPTLGFVPAGQAGNVNMELEKMKLENERWKIEETWKREERLAELTLKKQGDKDKMKLVKDIVGTALKRAEPAIKSAVQAASNKLGTMGKKGAESQVTPTQTLCPECLKQGKQVLIDVSGMPDSVTCPECGTTLAKQGA
jgi:hypothetical protein